MATKNLSALSTAERYRCFFMTCVSLTHLAHTVVLGVQDATVLLHIVRCAYADFFQVDEPEGETLSTQFATLVD